MSEQPPLTLLQQVRAALAKKSGSEIDAIAKKASVSRAATFVIRSGRNNPRYCTVEALATALREEGSLNA